ncbi:uncharacterized protein TRUGW13939_01755 [Talaromyces rugulosus]|uniref:Uncharacterized protein n=1 Tax=Talaromyces rugulosus TaxID=121627 RepID=A0A7H8QL74_TALRU|nr:uncharacterized protein TRUGW13939_01755 [Talaromyces rugulosus]QKX54667.1 hypothetical protein TRUGW13939_01755 [Talaromyces rugulosus]
MLRTPAECHRFIESQSPAAIAEHLRRDQQRCRDNKMPSMLAVYLPASSSPSSPLYVAISNHLSKEEVHPSVKRLQYDGIIKSIKAYLHQLDRDQSGESNVGIATAITPTPEDFSAAIKVLEYLQKEKNLTGRLTNSTPLADIMNAINAHMGIDPIFRTAFSSALDANASRKCYVCRQKILRSESHYLYNALCRPCGSFNLTMSELAYPPKFNLWGKTALVTGGRVNLGFHTALRLLRCGANVIVSTRYPHDAESRYAQQHDAEEWSSRLRIIGADFRTARDAFELVSAVKWLLREWTKSKLHILINNAAQTLTDPVKSEVAAIVREKHLQDSSSDQSQKFLPETRHTYEPRVRGGMQAAWVSGIEGNFQRQIKNGSLTPEDYEHPPLKGLGGHDNKTERSSWVQTVEEIPYEDIISAFAVNSFVPLILCRELLHIMGHRSGAPRPEGYIVNVSSREGILENKAPKAGYHVHTNMSKAAVNMITETEAENAWAQRVAMNTVDPGYMSAAPEIVQDDGCPIGFEDGASRVLWPIAVGEMDDATVVRGRFLKHFGEVGASIQRG